MRYVLKISDIWYWTVCNPGLGDRTEAQFFFEDFIDGVEDSEVCLEIEAVSYTHLLRRHSDSARSQRAVLARFS